MDLYIVGDGEARAGGSRYVRVRAGGGQGGGCLRLLTLDSPGVCLQQVALGGVGAAGVGVVPGSKPALSLLVQGRLRRVGFSLGNPVRSWWGQVPPQDSESGAGREFWICVTHSASSC